MSRPTTRATAHCAADVVTDSLVANMREKMSHIVPPPRRKDGPYPKARPGNAPQGQRGQARGVTSRFGPCGAETVMAPSSPSS